MINNFKMGRLSWIIEVDRKCNKSTYKEKRETGESESEKDI